MNKLKSFRWKHDERKEKLKQKLNGKYFSLFQPCLQSEKKKDVYNKPCHQINKTVVYSYFGR